MTYRNGGLRHIYYSRPIEEMNLPPRALNAFKREGIVTIGQLFGRTIEEILDMRNIGAGTIGDILAEGAAGSSTDDRITALEHRVDKLEEAVSKYEPPF